jgi:predicted CoA-substrate-specific enzyme activase
MKVVAGIDVGSGRTKCVLADERGKIAGSARAKTLPDFDKIAANVLHLALEAAGLNSSDVLYVAATGLGRHAVSFRQIQITDITCTARGARAAFPGCRFILDIGAQSTRAIRLGEDGTVREFRTNEKCAAGSGGFLERACRYLEIPLEKLGELSAQSQVSQSISSICAVLAESEIINHVSEGRKVEDILHGIHVSLAERAQLLLKRVGFEGDLIFTGGVALQRGMIRACQETFKVPVHIPDNPDLVCATGAALLGWYRLKKQLLAEKSV